MSDKKSSLREWRNRVGDIEADRVMKEATDIGTMVHLSLENHLNGIDDDIFTDNSLGNMAKRMSKKLIDDNTKGSVSYHEGDVAKSLEANDKLVITRLNQLARSIRHLEDIKNFLEVKNVDLIAIKQDLNTSNKKMDFYNMVSLISEFEMDLRLERQLIGIQKAKNNGVKFGRKPIDDKVVEKIKQLFAEGMSIAQISLTLALGKSTIYRLLKQ